MCRRAGRGGHIPFCVSALTVPLCSAPLLISVRGYRELSLSTSAKLIWPSPFLVAVIDLDQLGSAARHVRKLDGEYPWATRNRTVNDGSCTPRRTLTAEDR